ncbi:MAG: hypothetical protein I3274_02730 [Candidatus Moeniiplasma glomeromycotorum]|nr:hypothetical protein [Candidatus Moeniiplasma glomeromycotorum]MCE8167520.1 hypothetical protein [Candidatus Moeniiplasma glomeromycotorum]
MNLSLSLNQQITQLVQAILTPAQKGECKCHWLDANKVRILAWPSQKDPDTLILKVAEQKFIGLVRSDKRNEKYWKFKNVEDLEAKVSAPVSNLPPEPETKPLVKEPESANLPGPESTPLENEESDPVKKFREKYGKPNFDATNTDHPK